MSSSSSGRLLGHGHAVHHGGQDAARLFGAVGLGQVLERRSWRRDRTREVASQPPGIGSGEALAVSSIVLIMVP
jgi:hypothetical protein